jgi:xanthine dehydrogenase YagT iron-sulfur-binding subunit
MKKQNSEAAAERGAAVENELMETDELNSALSEFGAARRKFLGQFSATTAALLAANLITPEQALAFDEILEDSVVEAVSADQNAVSVKLKINGAEQSLTVDSRVTLLDALRERLGLTGSKKGCDHGQCGACTVIMDGRRVLSCLTLAAMCDGRDVTTVEGLAKGDALHPMQAAFIKHDGFQCGYCTPGQICSAVALMQEARNGEASYVTANLRTNAKNLKLSDDEIRERMSGNICRCGAYPNIVTAIKEVHGGKPIDSTAWNFVGEKEEDNDATV